MKNINLRDFYPELYKEDQMLEVPDAVYETLQQSRREEMAYERKMYRYHAQYSLNSDMGYEKDAIQKPSAPHEIFEKKMLREELLAMVNALPDKQAKRIYAHFFLGMSVTEIAEEEGVSKSRVSESIKSGKEKLLKKFLE